MPFGFLCDLGGKRAMDSAVRTKLQRESVSRRPAYPKSAAPGFPHGLLTTRGRTVELARRWPGWPGRPHCRGSSNPPGGCSRCTRLPSDRTRVTAFGVGNERNRRGTVGSDHADCPPGLDVLAPMEAGVLNCLKKWTRHGGRGKLEPTCSACGPARSLGGALRPESGGYHGSHRGLPDALPCLCCSVAME